MKKMIDISKLNNDERIIFNEYCESNRFALDIESFITSLAFAKESSTDSDIIYLYDNFIDKIKKLNKDEWASMLKLNPLATYYDMESSDEEVTTLDD